MQSKNKTLIAPRLMALLLFVNLCIACAGGTSLSPGAWVPDEDRIAVKDDGPHKGSWKTRDLSIHYESQKAASTLQIKGLVELANSITTGFSVLEFLHLNIHFLEANGVVLETQRIRSFGSFRSFRVLGDLRFSGQYELPQDTVAFAFSYSGKVNSGGGAPGIMGSDGGTDWSFWRVPHRSPPK